MNKVVLLLLLLIAQPLFALITDIKKPIDVAAQQAALDRKNGVSTYTGHVIVTQGTLLLKANMLTVHHPQKQVSKIEALGTEHVPASYQQLPEGKTQYVYASADKMTYLVAENFLKLEGNAKLTQDKNTFSGNKIEYDIRLDKVLTTGAQDGSDARVKLRFTDE